MMMILVVGGLAVGGIMFMRSGGFANLFPAPVVADPTPVITTPPPSTTDAPAPANDVNAIKPDTTIINNTIINNYQAEFLRRYPSMRPSRDTTTLFINFQQNRYLADDDYRRQIIIVVNRMPSRERDFWKDVLRRLDRYIKDTEKNRHKPPVIIIPPGGGGGRPPRPQPRPQPQPKPCVQTVMCAANSHWDTHQCKCVVNTVPLPNTNPHPHDGRDTLVDGASSNYSRSRLVNVNKLSYW